MVYKLLTIAGALMLTAGVTFAQGISRSGELSGGRQIGPATASGAMGGQISGSSTGLSTSGEMGGTVGLNAAGTNFSRSGSIGGSLSLSRLRGSNLQTVLSGLTEVQLQQLSNECQNDELAKEDKATCDKLAEFRN
jgi:hypothetical protein